MSDQEIRRALAFQNIDCRLEWERRHRYGFRYPDARDPLIADVLDQSRREAVEAARAVRDDLICARRNSLFRVRGGFERASRFFQLLRRQA